MATRGDNYSGARSTANSNRGRATSQPPSLLRSCSPRTEQQRQTDQCDISHSLRGTGATNNPWDDDESYNPWDDDESYNPWDAASNTQSASTQIPLHLQPSTLQPSNPFDEFDRTVTSPIPPIIKKTPQRRRSPSPIHRESCVRKCDGCRKTYIAISPDGKKFDDLEIGSPERICDRCLRKRGGAMVRLVDEEELILDEMEALNLDEDDGEEDGASGVTQDFFDEHDRYDELRKEEKAGRSPSMYESFDSGLNELRTARGSFVEEEDEDLFGEDCFTYSGKFRLRSCRPCHRHRLGDPDCWLGRDIQDVPEGAYSRYWKSYMKARQPPGRKWKLKRNDVRLRPGSSKLNKTKMIYKPSCYWARDIDMSKIDEDREWRGLTMAQKQKMSRLFR